MLALQVGKPVGLLQPRRWVGREAQAVQARRCSRFCWRISQLVFQCLPGALRLRVLSCCQRRWWGRRHYDAPGHAQLVVQA
ncbi:hypothetical protein HBH43_079430 [Parastagonospora nodorum]|nr:hypothetical protein HBH43_079430 [Parastagonospora nodorum]